MSRRPLNNLGDLLTACAHTGATDDKSVREIAQLLGLAMAEAGAGSEPQQPASAQERSSTPGDSRGQEEKSQQSGSTAATPPSLQGGEPLSITAVNDPVQARPPPAWLGKGLPPPPPEGSRRSATLRLEPLFRPSWTRNLVAGAVATLRPEGPLHLDALVELLGVRRPINRLPRQLRPTLRAGAQVLVDRAETMEPFSADVELLLERIHAVVGRERTQVYFFDASPWRTGMGPRRSWREHRFQRGTPILALTCLDINAAPYRALATALDWLMFADAARNAQCPLVAAVPYPPSRWPEGLAERMSILEWDRGTTVGHVRRLMRRRSRTA